MVKGKWNLDKDVDMICGMKWLIILKEWLKMYLENLKDVDKGLMKLSDGIRRSKQQLD